MCVRGQSARAGACCAPLYPPKGIDVMTAIEIARQLAAMGQPEGAIKAYGVVLHQPQAPEEELEAALYILQNGGDYKVSYSTLIDLHRRGCFQEDCLSILTQAFYEPNMKLQKSRYEKNCRELKRYPYLFRKDFPAFEDLPVLFYPFDDMGYLPFLPSEGRFGAYINFKKPVISRNFFKNLDNPILAKDVYSQYELEYLNDNVRKSENIGRENHVYLHYSSWGEFCAHLKVLNLRPLLKSEKLVFLMEDEEALYPIDFKERFGIDYSTFPVKPIAIREVHRLIWHTQLSSHNGGDFFNEIFDAHPNLIVMPSVMMKNIETNTQELKDTIIQAEKNGNVNKKGLTAEEFRLVGELFSMSGRTDKDFLVAGFMSDTRSTIGLDPASRIAPAIFLQPHFGNLDYSLTVDPQGRTVLRSEQYASIQNSSMFRNFKYIKTFSPMRRITSSYGAALRFMQRKVAAYQKGELVQESAPVVDNEMTNRLMNRSFMLDPEDRLYQDSVLVRFEDAKLNPKATFTALAAFLDIPYAESMTYCSLFGERNPESMAGNDLGFSTAAVYRTYDEYANDAERAFIEYFMRDAYEAYGYEFHYYDGESVDEARAEEWISGFTTVEHLICDAWEKNVFSGLKVEVEGRTLEGEELEQVQADALKAYQRDLWNNWRTVAQVLLRGLRFVNKNGQPLRMMPKLELDPALLEQPLYH